MSNKFLGLDSINVLVDYIDKEIAIRDNASKLVTIVAYKYVADTDEFPEIPVDGGFDFNGGNVVYPNGWTSLKSLLESIGDNSAIEAALAVGSIYMSTAVELANEINWSYPVKISGQNGISARFAYSYDRNAAEADRTNVPSGVNVDNRIEYVWTKYGESDWSGPTIWAMYTQDAAEVLYRYCVTATSEKPNAPVDDNDSNWMTSSATSLSEGKPYMWLSSKRVPAGVAASTCPWSEPILYGRYATDGKDGEDGLDGNIPDYSITLYSSSLSFEDVPTFICEVGDKLENVLTNNTNWYDIPTGADNEVIWNVVININGGTRENPELKDTVKSLSVVRRFSAIDGDVKSSVYTKYLFYWSVNQTIPENLADDAWVENPEYKVDEQDGSLWMKFGVARIDTATGDEVVLNTDKPYSDPIKLTGPRGPIAYDYRTESLFGAGTADKEPTTWKRMSEVKTNNATPYIWEKRYLSLYKMKYADKVNADGTYDVVEDKFLKQIGEPDVFRLSGLNGLVGNDGKDGVNGNRLNTIDYTTTDKNLSISNFDEINYFISNSASDTHYVLNGNKFGDFVSGYTGKFINIGTGNMIITTIDAQIVGSNTAVVEIIVKPQESIDLIGYNNDNKCEFILIGKPVIENPVEDPGVLSEASLLDAITTGGDIKLGNNIELSSTPLIIENDVVIDLNGYTITAPTFMESGGAVLEGNTDSYVFWVKEGNLTIKGNGKAIAQPADYSMAVWCQGGNVTIESGEFRNGGESCSLIYASGTGNIVIKGGKFIATPKAAQEGTGDEYTALNLKDRDNMTCSIKVEGGHYYGFDPAHNLAEDNADWWEANPNGFVADGFVSIPNGEWYSVIPTPEV